MKVNVRGEGINPTQAQEMAVAIKASFKELAHRVASVLVVMSTQAEKRHAARHCLVEVHMADGHVEYVEERQRRVGAALRRAGQRAWKAAAQWLKQQVPVSPSQAISHAGVLAPIKIRSSDREWGGR